MAKAKKKTGHITPEMVREYFEYRDGKLFYKKNAGYNKTLGLRAGNMTRYGYWTVRVRKQHIAEHRAIWMLFNGSLPEGVDLDHINGDRLDNRIENLRLASRSLNNANSKKRRNTTSRYKGVSWSKVMKRWHAYITPEVGKRITLGYFDVESEATLAYNAKASEIFGTYARINEVTNHG